MVAIDSRDFDQRVWIEHLLFSSSTSPSSVNQPISSTTTWKNIPPSVVNAHIGFPILNHICIQHSDLFYQNCIQATSKEYSSELIQHCQTWCKLQHTVPIHPCLKWQWHHSEACREEQHLNRKWVSLASPDGRDYLRFCMQIHGGCLIHMVVVAKVVGVQKERECTTHMVKSGTVGIDACATIHGIRNWMGSVRAGQANIPRWEAKHSGRVTLDELRNASVLH